MKRRWAFCLALVFAVVAFCLQFWSVGGYITAKKQLTEDFIRHVETGNPVAEALLQRSEVVSKAGMPVAVTSILCLFLSHRRREPAWRWPVGLLLCLYGYFLVGPV